jgi:hypothetical protein
MRDPIEIDSQENAAVASAIAFVAAQSRSPVFDKKVTLMNNIEAHIDAIKSKNVELSSEHSIAREQLDKVTPSRGSCDEKGHRRL